MKEKDDAMFDIYHILTFFIFFLRNMFKFIILFLIVEEVSSSNVQVTSISEHPLFKKIFALIDQLVIQVRKMQTLIICTYDMIEQIPNDLRPFFLDCFTTTHNISRIQYSLNLNEAELTRLPQIKYQLNQAKTLEQQLNVMNITDRIVADITLNIVKPSLLFVNEILDCLKSKTQLTL